MPGFTTWYVPENRSPSGMTADIFPLSPKSPERHVMFNGAAGWPPTATRPVTSPEAQPRAAPASKEMPAVRPTLLHIWPSLLGSFCDRPPRPSPG